MSDSNADAFIVGDVNDGLEAGSSRWTRRRPSLRFYLDTVDQLRFQADFSIAESTFRDTGPVAVSVFINGNLLDTVHCPAPAVSHFDKPVPVTFLHAQSLNFATLEIDKLWSPPSRSVELGFLLARAGFSR
jgi:hypothetical protein